MNPIIGADSLAYGEVTSEDLTGSMAGQSLDALVAKILEGNVLYQYS